VLWEFIVGGVDSGAPSLQTFSLNLFLSETACEGARAHHVKSFADDSAKVLAKKLVNGDVAIVTGSRGLKLKRFIMGCDPINFELKLKDKKTRSMLMKNWAILLSFVITAGCAHVAGYENSKVEGIKVLKSTQAASLAEYTPQGFEHSFAKGEDSTKAVIDFLANAKKAGADYVSDIKISIVTDKESCATLLVPEEEIKSNPVIKTTSGRTETSYVLKPVTRTVTENEYRCQMVQKPVQSSETYYDQQYDSYSKSSRSVPRTRYVTRYESQNDCRYTPVTKTATRYEYEWESHYIPPKTEYLSENYSEWKLLESEPTCVKHDDALKMKASGPSSPSPAVGTLGTVSAQIYKKQK
jgi:hypothetical protein